MKSNIRIFLFILVLLLIGTPITIRNTVSSTDILKLDTHYLNKNITIKEKLVDKIFNDTLLLKTFSNSESYPLQLQDIANDYIKKQVYLYIYKNDTPIFWSNNTYVPPSASDFTKQTSFLKTENFSFIVKKKIIKDDIVVLFLIPIEQNYLTTKNFKKNQLLDYLQADNLELAEFSDSKNIRNIYSADNTFLFSVTLKPGKYNSIYNKLQIYCWIIAILLFIIIISNICYSFAKNKKAIKSIFLLAITLLLIRIFDLETNWISSYSNLDIFLPSNYSFNYFTPNAWAFLANSFSVFWLLAYIVYIKKYIVIPKVLKRPKLSWIIYYILLTFLYIFCTYIFDLLATLITHSSNYQKDLAQFFYSNNLISTYIIIYVINIICIVLITNFIINIIIQLEILNIAFLNIQLLVLIQFIIINSANDKFSFITLLIGLLIFIRLFDKIISNKFNKTIHIITIIIIALITNIKFSEANKTALLVQMKVAISAIQSEDDVLALNRFKEIEQSIFNDKQLKNILELTKQNESDILNEYIKKKYLLGYISKYNFSGYYFINKKPLGDYSPSIINFFREKVIDQSIKVKETESFYKTQITSIGIYEYFSILKLPISESETATLILDFTNKNTNELIYALTGEKSVLHTYQNMEDNSFAIYRNGQLISQKGKYIYPNKDIHLPKQINEFISYETDNGYYHLLFRNKDNETIVVSKPEQPYWQFVAIASVVFLLLYALSFIVTFFLTFFPRVFNKEFRLRYINYQIKDIYNTIRYSTRIQTLVISSVVIVILISGLITFFSVRYQSQKTRENNRLKLITQISNKLEIKALTDNSNNQLEYLTQVMDALTNVAVTDFNLYDKNGILLYTTQPKLYEQNLISKYINPNALIDLNVLKKVETHKNESIADLQYESVYATIKNSNYNNLAYISIPFYNAQEIEDDSRDTLLNTIFNIYTVIIIFFSFLSIYIANKITAPLQMIRKKLTTTNLDDKLNEPLFWKKNDEIGLLIRDYNYMLVKLEENAKQLRNAERETAWREMAKQVAHEIKNPLTPMKLGIQQLTRSFQENDPKLKERFEKVSSSFIEQIDALALIANEFSTFAKLPDTNLTPIDLIKEIKLSIEVYKHSKNTIIKFENTTNIDAIIILGDHDQMLRVFNNLLKNAIEASSNKRKHDIKITIDPIDTNWIKISITDNGDGIPFELRKNIFKPNFTTKSSGTGLGLAFVKQAIDSMAGRIYYQSQLNIGTTFFIELPLHKKNMNHQ